MYAFRKSCLDLTNVYAAKQSTEKRIINISLTTIMKGNKLLGNYMDTAK